MEINCITLINVYDNAMKRYINEEKFKDSSKFKQHPTLGVWCDRLGNLYSGKTGKRRTVFKLRHKHDGYLQLSLKRSSYVVHRIMAQTWIPNPENKPCVNHKNGIKDDNRIENLEWCTQLENVIHARDVLGVKYSLPGYLAAASKFKERELFIAVNLYKRGFDYKEIGEIMGFSFETIRSHIYQIKKKVKNGMDIN